LNHASHDATCAICRTNAKASSLFGGVIWEDELWLVRHASPPCALVGWTMLHTQRHVQGPAHFNDVEAASYGTVLRHLTSTLQQVSGAERIYVIALGESYPHMHAHLVPRYANLPKEFSAFGIADLFRAVADGRQPGASETEALAMAERLRRALETNPPRWAR
jgi:diadenosine tetraphosphate (Ap4A) HIT family hydrolase